ncbi:unnamed protein product [Boreogadus saida]
MIPLAEWRGPTFKKHCSRSFKVDHSESLRPRGPGLRGQVICWYCRGLSGFCRWLEVWMEEVSEAGLCTVKSAVFGQEGVIVE